MKKLDYWRKRLKRWRKEKGLNQEDLAKISNTSQPTISQLKTGGRNFTLETLDKILEKLDKNYSDLFTLIDIQELAHYFYNSSKRIEDPHDFDPIKYRKIPPNVIKLIKNHKS